MFRYHPASTQIFISCLGSKVKLGDIFIIHVIPGRLVLSNIQPTNHWWPVKWFCMSNNQDQLLQVL